MRKLKYLIFILLFTFCFNVKAAVNCKDERQAELIRIANSITFNYEETTITNYNEEVISDDFEGTKYLEETVFKVTLYNLTKDIYVEVTNNLDSNKLTFKGTDYLEGMVSFNSSTSYELEDFTIKVYSADTLCYGNLLTTKYYQTPIINGFYDTAFCLDNSDKDFCKKYLYYTMTLENFSNYINSNYEADNGVSNDSENNIIEFISNNKYYFIAGFLVVLVGAATTIIIIVVKRRGRDF